MKEIEYSTTQHENHSGKYKETQRTITNPGPENRTRAVCLVGECITAEPIDQLACSEAGALLVLTRERCGGAASGVAATRAWSVSRTSRVARDDIFGDFAELPKTGLPTYEDAIKCFLFERKSFIDKTSLD